MDGDSAIVQDLGNLGFGTEYHAHSRNHPNLKGGADLPVPNYKRPFLLPHQPGLDDKEAGLSWYS